MGDHRDPARSGADRSWRETRRSARRGSPRSRPARPTRARRDERSRAPARAPLSALRGRAEIAGEHAALAHQRLDRDREIERPGDDRSRSPARAGRGSRSAASMPAAASWRAELLGLTAAVRGQRRIGDARDRSGCARNAGSIPTRHGAPGSSRVGPSRRAAAAARPPRPPRSRRRAPAAVRRWASARRRRRRTHALALEVVADPPV